MPLAIARRLLPAFAQVLALAANLAAIAILARLLSKTDFGVYAYVLALTTLPMLVAEASLGTLAVRRHPLPGADLTVAMVLYAAYCVVAFVLLLVVAPALGFDPGFDMRPILAMVVTALAVRGSAALPLGVMRREGRVGVAVAAETASVVVGVAVVPCIVAGMGGGLWALPAGLAAQAAIRWGATLAAWPRPAATGLTVGRIVDVLGLTVGVGLSSAMNFLGQNVGTFWIGNLLGAAPLGIYSRAYSLASVPLRLYDSVHQMLLFPELARETEKARLADRASALAAAALGVGAALGCAVVSASAEIVTILLGKDWRDVTPVLQWLAVALPARAALRALEGAAIVADRPFGSTWRYLVLAVASSLAVLAVKGEGLAAISAALAATTWCLAGLSLIAVRRLLSMPLGPLMRAGAGALLATLATLLVVWKAPADPDAGVATQAAFAVVKGSMAGALGLLAVVAAAGRPLRREAWLILSGGK